MANIYFERLEDSLCTSDTQPTASHQVPKPSWWKDMPRYHTIAEELSNQNLRDFSTVRNCPAISDSMNFGYTLYLPYDIHIDTSSKDVVKFYHKTAMYNDTNNNATEYVGLTNNNAISNFYVPEGYCKTVIRINLLWGIKTDPDYSIFVTQPSHRYDLPLLAISGVIDTDTFPAREAYNFWVKDGFTGTIKAGTPLVQIIPFKREDFSSHVIENDHYEYVKIINKLTSAFTNGYKKFFWHRKKFD
jgi:hypothetical protein